MILPDFQEFRVMSSGGMDLRWSIQGYGSWWILVGQGWLGLVGQDILARFQEF